MSTSWLGLLLASIVVSGCGREDTPPSNPNALLAWSYNRDGEAPPDLIQARDRRMKVDTAEKRRERAELEPRAKPQMGTDALKP